MVMLMNIAGSFNGRQSLIFWAYIHSLFFNYVRIIYILLLCILRSMLAVYFSSCLVSLLNICCHCSLMTNLAINCNWILNEDTTPATVQDAKNTISVTVGDG